MSLIQAIDEAVGFVREHPDEMKRNDVEELHRLAERVYVLAYQQGLGDALPNTPDMQPQLASEGLPPVQFESKLNLPGDWETVLSNDDNPLPSEFPLATADVATNCSGSDTDARVFLVEATPRWFQDMRALRSLAEAHNTSAKKTGRRPKNETSGSRQVVAAIQTLLQDRRPDDPPTGKEIVETSGIRNVSRFIKKWFGSQKEFEAAWRRGDVVPMLAQAEYSPLPGRHKEFDENRMQTGGKHRRGRTPGTDDYDD